MSMGQIFGKLNRINSNIDKLKEDMERTDRKISIIQEDIHEIRELLKSQAIAK